MHYYLLDSQGLPEAEFEKRQTELMGLAHEYNIRGETGRISSLRSIKELVATAQKRDTRTLVVCGNDDTFNQALGALQNYQFVLGFVPLVEKTQLAKLLGITNIQSAVKTLAARRLALVDTAKVANVHFFSYLEFGICSTMENKTSWLNVFKRSARPILLKAIIDGSYEISSEVLGGLIINAKGWKTQEKFVGDPKDGHLDLILTPKSSLFNVWNTKNRLNKNNILRGPGNSRIRFKQIEIVEPVGLSLTMLGRQITRVPATITIAPNFLNMIVGRDRTF